MDTYFNESVQG